MSINQFAHHYSIGLQKRRIVDTMAMHSCCLIGGSSTKLKSVANDQAGVCSVVKEITIYNPLPYNELDAKAWVQMSYAILAAILLLEIIVTFEPVHCSWSSKHHLGVVYISWYLFPPPSKAAFRVKLCYTQLVFRESIQCHVWYHSPVVPLPCHLLSTDASHLHFAPPRIRAN